MLLTNIWWLFTGFISRTWLLSICLRLYFFFLHRWPRHHRSHHLKLLPRILCSHQLLLLPCILRQVSRSVSTRMWNLPNTWKSQFHKCISDVQQTFSQLIFFKFPHVKCILSRVNYIHNIHIAGFFHMLSGIPSCENKVCHMRLWIKFELKYNHYIFFNVE